MEPFVFIYYLQALENLILLQIVLRWFVPTGL